MQKDYTKVINNLDKNSYNVTQLSATEKPFENEYDNHFEKGIYIDKVSKVPLFISTDKYHSGCGWPSFSKPINKDKIIYSTDNTLTPSRTEVSSSDANSHLGHVFNDGPKERGGMRYCINSASLIFVHKEQLVKEGYNEYLKLFDE